MNVVGRPDSQFLMSHPHLVRHLPHFSTLFQTIKAKIDRTYEFFAKQIEEHHRTCKNNLEEEMEEEDRPKDFVSAFLREMKRRNGEDGFE